jgi:hypothetical protein
MGAACGRPTPCHWTAAEGLLVPDRDVLFGASLGQWNGADATDAAGRIRLGVQADRDGLDLIHRG